MHNETDSEAPVVSRRGFAAAALALLLGADRGRSVAPHDPRLDARPGPPWRPVEVGLTRLGPDLRRGADLYVPEAYSADAPAPLVLALHGAGGSANTWRRWQPASEERGFVLLAPDSRDRTWDSAYGAIGPDARFIDATLRHTFESCAIDPRRIALVGFSDGASYTLSLGPSNGDLFTHLVAFSPGFSNPENPIVGRPRVFISHGDRDGVLPVAATRSGIAPMFEMDGYDVRYVEFEGGHEMPEPVVAQALAWLLEGSAPPARRR